MERRGERWGRHPSLFKPKCVVRKPGASAGISKIDLLLGGERMNGTRSTKKENQLGKGLVISCEGLPGFVGQQGSPIFASATSSSI